MIGNQKINTVKPKRRRILKANYYLKRLLRKLRKRLVRRWREMPFIRHHVVKDSSNLKNRLHKSPKKIQHRRVSTTEEDKISRVKSFKFRSQCSALNIDQDFITLKTPPLKVFSVLTKPIRIFTLSRLIYALPVLTKTFYYSKESIQESRTRPIVITNTGLCAYIPSYKYTDFHHKRRLITHFNFDKINHFYFYFVKEHPLFKKDSFDKSIKPEDSEINLNSSKACLDNIMQQLDNSTADVFKLKEDAKKLKKHLKNSENSPQETECFIRQLQALEEKAKKIESLRIQAMKDIINIDINSKDSEGKTLAHHLAEYGDFLLLKDLISFNLNPFIKDNQGFLPKDTANNNRLGIIAKHMENTQEFLRSLTLEEWGSRPKQEFSFELNINTRGYFMPNSNSFKETKTTNSSGNRKLLELGNPNSHSNTDFLLEIIRGENSDQDLEELNGYLYSNPPINFKRTCNEAIHYNKPFYLFIILNCFKNHLPTKYRKDGILSPIICAMGEERLYPFAMLLLCTDRFKDLHITHKSNNREENAFDMANRIGESFYVFLLVKKEKNIINTIDKKHTNISKEAIEQTINDPKLDSLYKSIELKFNKLKSHINSLLCKETPKRNIRDIISFTEKYIIEIEKDLEKLKEEYDLTYQRKKIIIQPTFFIPLFIIPSYRILHRVIFKLSPQSAKTTSILLIPPDMFTSGILGPTVTQSITQSTIQQTISILLIPPGMLTNGILGLTLIHPPKIFRLHTQILIPTRTLTREVLRLTLTQTTKIFRLPTQILIPTRTLTKEILRLTLTQTTKIFRLPTQIPIPTRTLTKEILRLTLTQTTKIFRLPTQIPIPTRTLTKEILRLTLTQTTKIFRLPTQIPIPTRTLTKEILRLTLTQPSKIYRILSLPIKIPRVAIQSVTQQITVTSLSLQPF